MTHGQQTVKLSKLGQPRPRGPLYSFLKPPSPPRAAIGHGSELKRTATTPAFHPDFPPQPPTSPVVEKFKNLAKISWFFSISFSLLRPPLLTNEHCRCMWRRVGTVAEGHCVPVRSPSCHERVVLNNAPRVSGTPEPCGARNAAQADQWSPEACEDCDSDRLGISEACKDCGSSRLGVSEVCKDGIDRSGMGVHLGGENFSFEMFLN
ncbi:unnamed protein product [Prunus armeniaca]